MKEVSFRRLSLAGFGPYRDRVEVVFGPGVNALVAPNERGKSSLVSGLLATIFGLPARTDPSVFGQARFKNWDSPQRFEGEVEFEADGTVYRIRRDFDTHRVSLAKLENARYTALVTGEHNPGATRKPNEAYETSLAELIGITSRELFEHTFCVTQPIPEAKHLDEKVQELLSGAGGGFARALDRLINELSAQTKTTGERGVTSRNQRNDRVLEELTSRIEALESEIDASRRAVDSLQPVLRRLNDIERDLDESRKALLSKETILKAWSDWKRLAADYRRATKDQTSLEAAVDKARDLSAEIDAETRKVREEFPEFEGAPQDTEPALTELITLRAKHGEAERAISDAENAIRVKQEELDRLLGEIRALRDWGALGPAPEAAVHSAKRKAAELVEKWRVFLGCSSELSACEEYLSARFRVFAEASPEELELLAVYSTRLAELTRDMERTRSDLETLQERTKAIESAREEFQRRYAGIAALGPGAADTIRRRLDALRREKRLQAELAERRRLLDVPRGTRAAAGFASALVAAVVVWSSLGGSATVGNTWVSLAAAVLFGLAGYVVSGVIHARRVGGARLEAKRIESELSECRRELTLLGEALGDLASSDEATLGALLERVGQRDEEASALTEKEALLPSDEEAVRIREAFERAEKNYGDFVERTGRFAEHFEDVGAAFSEWKGALDERSRLESFVRGFARESFGCEPEAAAQASLSAPSVSDEWRELSRFVSVAASPEDAGTVGRLIAFLEREGRDASWWERRAAEAGRYESLRKGIQAAQAAIEAGKQHIEVLRSRVKEFEERDAEVSRPLGTVLAASGGDPAGARKRWEERRSLLERVEAMRASLATLLGQHGAASLDELREKSTDARNNAAQSLAEWKRLVSENPGLPEIDEADDVERREAKWSSLNDDVERLRRRITALEKERGDLSAEQGRLQGRSSVNIAQAEVELAGLKRRREEVKLLVDALTTACLELSRAVKDFQGSYRALLQDAATNHFEVITGVRNRVVVIEDDFKIHIEEGGVPCDLAQLSKGAQDQLYIALRLAVADLLAQDYRLPFIFDDPFAACDSGRLANLRDVLQRMSKDRQILVLSHLEPLADWGEPVGIREYGSLRAV
ncbi:MAG: AAA family ATPase [Clostridia bacterium]